YSKLLSKKVTLAYHLNNLKRLMKHLILPNVAQKSTIHVVGGYGFFLKNELEEILIKNNFKIGNTIARPMDELIKLI
ncbi:MAG: hypothetical protein KJ941_13410, partial [Bacteroidetes bacterium]|nr:hypothetical protein [Bacteroidota bacterium]